MFTIQLTFARRAVIATASLLGLIAIIVSTMKETSVAADESDVGAIATEQQVLYKTTKIEGLEIAYREAGPTDAPAVLLLHGFPTSSHMFRELLPALADRYHVIAPDYPGLEAARCHRPMSSSTHSTTLLMSWTSSRKRLVSQSTRFT